MGVGGEERDGGAPRESIQVRPWDGTPYTDWVLAFPSNLSEKEKERETFGRGGSVKMLAPFCCKK